MPIRHFLTLLLLCAMVHGAANAQTASDPPMGAIVASITYEDIRSSYTVALRSIDRAHHWAIYAAAAPVGLEAGQIDPSFDEGGRTGAMNYRALPAGEWEAFSWGVSNGASSFVNPTAPFSIRFTVVPGRTTYIGNFHFKPTSTFLRHVKAVNVSHRAMFEQDLPLLRKKFPDLAAITFDNELPAGHHQDAIGAGQEFQFNIPPPLIHR